MRNQLPTRDQLREAFHGQLHPGRQAAVISWASFTVTFGTVRALTLSIREQKGPFHNITPGGMHLHHYLWGIAAVSGVAGVAIRGERRVERHTVLAVVYGVGMALIVDELALLLDLRDVYWAKQGRWSVDTAVGIIGVAGLLLEGRPAWREMRRLTRHRS